MSGRADRPVPCGPYETEQQASGQGGAEAFWFGGGKFDRCITVEEFGHVQFRRFKPRAIYLGDEHPRGLSTPKLLRFTFALVKDSRRSVACSPRTSICFSLTLRRLSS